MEGGTTRKAAWPEIPAEGLSGRPRILVKEALGRINLLKGAKGTARKSAENGGNVRKAKEDSCR